jgi:hypothetical protein
MHVYLHNLRAHAKFREKQIFFAASTKKTKTHHEKAYFSIEFSHFYIEQMKSRFFK